MRFVGVCCDRLNTFDLRSRVRICTLVHAVKRAFIISNVIRSVTSHYTTSPAQLFHPSCPHFRTFSAALFLPLLYLCMPPTHQETSADKEMMTFLTVTLGTLSLFCLCGRSLFFLAFMSRTLLECQSIPVLISWDGQAWKLLHFYVLCCVSIHAVTVKTQLWFNIIYASFVSLHCPH